MGLVVLELQYKIKVHFVDDFVEYFGDNLNNVFLNII